MAGANGCRLSDSLADRLRNQSEAPFGEIGALTVSPADRLRNQSEAPFGDLGGLTDSLADRLRNLSEAPFGVLTAILESAVTSVSMSNSMLGKGTRSVRKDKSDLLSPMMLTTEDM